MKQNDEQCEVILGPDRKGKSCGTATLYLCFLLIGVPIFGLIAATIGFDWPSLIFLTIMLTVGVFGPTILGVLAIMRLFAPVRRITPMSWREQLCMAGVSSEAYLDRNLSALLNSTLEGCFGFGAWGASFTGVVALGSLLISLGESRAIEVTLIFWPVAAIAYTHYADAVAKCGVAELVIRASNPMAGRRQLEEARIGTIAALVLLPLVLFASAFVVFKLGRSYGLWSGVPLTLIVSGACLWIGLWLKDAARRNWRRAAVAFYTFD